MPAGCGCSAFWRCSPPLCSCSHCSPRFRCSSVCWLHAQNLIRQRLRALLAPIVVLAVVSGAWVVASMGEVAQVNWIANGSTESRLLQEVRGPVIGQVYDVVIFVILALAVSRLAVGTRERRQRCRRRSFELGPGHPCHGGRLGGRADDPSVHRLVRPSHLRGPVRLGIGSGGGPARSLHLRAHLSEDPRPAAASRIRRRTKDCKAAVGDPGRAATVVLVVGYLGSASAQQEDLAGPGPLRRPSMRRRGMSSPTRPRHRLGLDVLPGGRQTIHCSLATAWSSAALCRRI